MPQTTGQKLGILPATPNFTPAPAQTSQPQPQPPPQSVGSGSSPILPDPSTLDPQVLKVLHAIRSVESQGNYNAVGDNGSSMGAFQWNNGPTPVQPGQTPKNWQNAAKQFLGDPNAPMTPENQNYVAYQQISAYKAQGLSPNSIDALWNGAKPDPTQPGQYLHNNPQRLTTFQNALTQEGAGQNNGSTITPNQPEKPPSLQGFLGNTLSSAGNFAGNLVNAAIHPIQTVQGLGSMAAGGLQELGGQQNQNTQAFDNLKNYFVQRYNSPQALLHTAYTDPVGLAADVSAALGLAGGVVGGVSKLADVAGLTGTADVVGSAGDVLNTGSRLANPLTPAIAGVGKVLSSSGIEGLAKTVGSQLEGLKPQDMENIIANPSAYTPEQIANVTRLNLSQEVASALQDQIAQHSDTGAGYELLKQEGAVPAGYENVTNAPPANAIPVSQNFIEDQLRTVAKVDVQDGSIVSKGTSLIRATKDVNALQNLLDNWKPEFQKGYLTPEEFLNFRTDLANAAKFDREFSSSAPVQGVAAEIRSNLNATYRGAIPGLEQLDTQYSTETAALQDLTKGILDKEGNLKDSAINKIATAGNAGKDLQLAKLEQIMPGITQKLQVLKTIENIQKATEGKVGTFPSSYLKAGGVIYGLSTGNLPVAAVALATTFISEPEMAVPILRAIGNNKALISGIVAHMAKFATVGAVANASQSNSPTQTTPDTGAQSTNSPIGEQTAPQTPTPTPQTTGIPSQQDITQLPGYQAAIKAGYTDAEIRAYLAKQ
jgi:hypothetical protein